jgi:hypothetical protein
LFPDDFLIDVISLYFDQLGGDVDAHGRVAAALGWKNK